MQKDPNILKELNELSPMLAGLRDTNVFRVPEDYFEALLDNVMDNVKIAGIKTTGNKPSQSVPDGYFDSLSSKILQRIKDENAGETALDQYPVLSKIGNKNIYSVPEGYFEHFSKRVMAKLQSQQPAKVIPLMAHKVWRYAAAAVLAVGIFITSYFLVNSQQDKNGFAVITKSTVQDPAALQFNSAHAFNEGIASLTDEEIIHYLEDHGNILDNDVLLKNTDGSELPDAADYLVNEEALSNYLEKINIKALKKQ